MNTPRDESEDEVTGAYRRASDTEAGRPAPATRAAILAEARAATLRRTPAANESRYAWRAVAGIAVIGVAVLLWRQSERHVTPDLTVASSDRSGAAAEAPIPSQVGADSPAVSETPAEAPAAKLEMEEAKPAPATRAREDKRAEEAGSSGIASVATPVTTAPAAPAAQSMERASADAGPALAPGALRQSASDHQGLLQREFPEIWSGDRIAGTVWVEVDAEGKVVRKGVLSGTDTLASVATGADWTLAPVRTASGSSLQLAVGYVD
jgi:hypothetical protein